MTTDTAASAQAFAGLLELMRELDERFLGAEFGTTRTDDIIDGRLFVLHALQAALSSQIVTDPHKPVFRPVTAVNMKVLGDNSVGLG